MTRRSVAVGLAGLIVASAVATVVLLALSLWIPSDVFGFPGATTIFSLMCGAVGLVIAFRQPGNPIAWIMLVSGACGALYDLAGVYATYAVLVRGGALPGGEWAGWVASWAWLPMAAGIPAFLPLVFPDGRLLSRRWRPVVWYAGLVIAVFVCATALVPGWLLRAEYVRNPVSPFADGDFAFADVQAPLNALLFLEIVVAFASLVLRFRRSRDRERLQIKWFAYASALVVVMNLLVPLLQNEKPYQIVAVLTFNAVPIAIAIAILRYRLYDIDVLINRTLVYGATSAALAVTFFGGVLAFQTVLRPVTGVSEATVALSTLLSFALFQPIRRRAQDVVDRRFNRSRYDAARTLEAFGRRLRDEVDLDALRGELLGAVRETMAPAHASLWLRERR
jgi:hypothetical protein